MKNTNYLPRIIDKQIDELLNSVGAVCIQGPKWCGKTWSAHNKCLSAFSLGDPTGNFQNRKLANLNPLLILDGTKPRMIDEWQEVPELWDAIRFYVDQHPTKGQFILTGSATPNHKGIMHSGAGRIATIKMRPMSLYEAKYSSGSISLLELCHGKLTMQLISPVDLSTLIEYIIKGGWPGNLSLTTSQAAMITKSYLEAIVNDDIYRMEGIKRDLGKMKLLLCSLARNESTTASITTLMKDINNQDHITIEPETLKTYLDIFNRLFLLDDQPPFHPNIRSSIRIRQYSKRHFTDPSLVCALLNLNHDKLLANLDLLGFLFEALVERDLKIYCESFNAKLFHYQDYQNNEIDAVIELEDGSWCAFEIKLGANRIDDAAKNLLRIKRIFEEEQKYPAPEVLCVICGLTNAAYQRDDGVYVVPITALKP